MHVVSALPDAITKGAAHDEGEWNRLGKDDIPGAP